MCKDLQLLFEDLTQKLNVSLDNQILEDKIQYNTDKTLVDDISNDTTVSLFDSKKHSMDGESEKTSRYSNLSELYPEWFEIIKELSDEEIIDIAKSMDEWSDEYLRLCFEELKHRNLTLEDNV